MQTFEVKTTGDTEWVEVTCTSLSCRGRKYGEKGFKTLILQKDLDDYLSGKIGACCNECFCK